MKKTVFKVIEKYATFNHDFSGCVDENTELTSLNIDSLGWQEALIIIEEKLNRTILIDELKWEELKTVGDLYEELKFDPDAKAPLT